VHHPESQAREARRFAFSAWKNRELPFQRGGLHQQGVQRLEMPQFLGIGIACGGIGARRQMNWENSRLAIMTTGKTTISALMIP
jgi:hypothetical protein